MFLRQAAKEVEYSILYSLPTETSNLDNSFTEQHSVQTIKELYKLISDTQFHQDTFGSFLESHNYTLESKLHTLETTYKEEFKVSWEKIKLFEWHFQKRYPNSLEYSHEVLVKRKLSYFELCVDFQKKQKHLNKLCIDSIFCERIR